MSEAEKIIKDMPFVKDGLDNFYRHQTVLNALNQALNLHPVIVTFDSLLDRLEKCFVADPEVGKRFDRELAKKEYFDKAMERIETHKRQLTMF